MRCDAHVYERFRCWPEKLRFRCVVCGLVTRHYNAQDRCDEIPIHLTMTLAKRGYNIDNRSFQGPQVIDLTGPSVIDLTEKHARQPEKR